jgi:hypothetical protein
MASERLAPSEALEWVASDIIPVDKAWLPEDLGWAARAAQESSGTAILLIRAAKDPDITAETIVELSRALLRYVSKDKLPDKLKPLVEELTDAHGKPEIEDLLRETLIAVAKTELGWNVEATAVAQPGRPIVDVFEEVIQGFSKYKLAKAYVRWTRTHAAADLTDLERTQWEALFANTNKALK